MTTRAQIMAEGARIKQALLNLLEEGPRTNREICNLICPGGEVSMGKRLSRLAGEGYLYSERIDCEGAPFQMLYHLGSKTLGKSDIRQRIVHKWKSQPFQIDPITAAICRPAKHNGELTK